MDEKLLPMLDSVFSNQMVLKAIGNDARDYYTRNIAEIFRSAIRKKSHEQAEAFADALVAEFNLKSVFPESADIADPDAFDSETGRFLLR